MTDLGVHSIGEFVLAVPALTEAEHFYRSFGLVVSCEGNHLALRAAGGNHRWGRVIEAKSKFLHHITFHCFEEDLSRFKSRLETSGIRLLDAPREFASDGLWFRGHDGLLMEIRVGSKTSPDKLSEPKPPFYEAGVRSAPYRRLAEKIHVRRFSHMLLFTTDIDQAVDFYSNVLGFRLADRSADAIAFLYAIHGSDHHMVAFAKSDRPGLHHTSWEVPSIDEVGLGAMRMADQGYRRSWGTGRHVLGSNYFHYIRDPWGSWCEYTCGIDFIPASTNWTARDHPLEDGFYLWGPDLPPDFVVNFEGDRPEMLASSLANRTELLQRYNQPAPRYTSYPPAPHWGGAHGDVLISALRESTAPLSIYVHIPFCERLCLYCGCNVVVKKDHSVAGPYIDRLIAELDLVGISHGRLVTQMHWGGGTPTYLGPQQITGLFNAMADRFLLAAGGEFSIEIDPRVTTREHLQTLRSLGFNRLSMGIQDFDKTVQLAVRRLQSYEHTRELFEYARMLGFESINADLIYGLPKQTRPSFDRTLDLLLELSPDRVAVFSYAHVPSIRRQQKSFEKHLPPESEKLQLFRDAINRLTSAGYEHIGLDHFARPLDPLVVARDNSTLHRNFQGYTTHAETDLIGFGVSAISHVGATFTQNFRELSSYQDAVHSGRLPVFRGYVLSRDDSIRGAVIEECLCNGRISKDNLEKRFNIDFDDYFEAELMRLNELERDGLIEGRTARKIRVTPTGRIFIRAVASVFDAFQPSAVASKAI